MARNFLTRRLRWVSPDEGEAADVDALFDYFDRRTACEKLAVYIATSYIANALSGCEVQVIKGGKPARTDQLYWTLNVSPNPNQSGAQFMNALVTRLCVEAEALVVPWGDRLYLADGYSVKRNPLGDDLFHGVSIEGAQVSRVWRASDAYFFKLEDRRVRGLLATLGEDYAKLLAAAQTGFVQGHGRKYKLRLDTVKAGDATFAETYEKVIKKNLSEFMTSENAVYPEYAGTSLEEMRHEADSSTDGVISMRKEVFDIVGQAYKIPTSMMYGNTNNTREVAKQFLTYAVDPVARAISDELTRKSFELWEWSDGAHVKVDTTRINHVDVFDVATDVDKLISSGVFSIDDVLESLGRQPLGTDFSRAHFMTKNYELAENAMTRISGGGDTNE